MFKINPYKSLSFVVPGIPFGKPRPRACIRGNHASVYYDHGAVKQEEQIARIAKAAAEDKGIHMIDCDEQGITVQIVFMFPVPKRASRKTAELMDGMAIRPMRKPDIDNLGKLVLDGINRSGIWKDDSQVVCLNMIKRYTSEDPKTSVYICWEEG